MKLSRYAIVGAKIFTGDVFIKSKAVVICGDTIEDIVDIATLGDIKQIDCSNKIIAPGFIDLQLNGCGGVLFNDNISEATLSTMHATNLKFGTTSFLPTLITAPQEDIISAIKVASAYHRKYCNSVIGVHIEGPYISKIKKGIHNPIHMHEIPEEIIDFLIESNKNIPIKITMAPEENSLDKIRRLALGGVKISIGHSNADYATAAAGINSGIRMATHLFNAMSAMKGRSPNVVGAVLNSDIYAGIIADGYHVDFNSIKIAKKLKGDKLFIVTDAVTPMGSDMKEFKFADQTIYVVDGKCVNSAGTLAGANIDMMSSVRNIAEYVGIGLEEALRMASLYPAKAMGVDFNLGRIAKGFIANLVVFDDKYMVKKTIDNGVIHNIND